MANRLEALTVSTFDATTLTGAYQVVNVGGFAEPCNIIKFVNTGDVSIMISYDGATDHDVVLAHSAFDIINQSNNRIPGYIAQFRRGTQVYVKAILGAGKSGDLYLIGYYS